MHAISSSKTVVDIRLDGKRVLVTGAGNVRRIYYRVVHCVT